jgi:C1q domain
METAIGMVDVKSSSVYFYVQRNEIYSTKDTIIPFNIEQLNIGGGMNIKSGIFTAPKSGIYFFSFVGLKEDNIPNSQTRVDLYRNGDYVATSYGTGSGHAFPTTVSSTLRLKSGDNISLRLFEGQLFSNMHRHVFFNGWLLQEETFSWFYFLIRPLIQHSTLTLEKWK